VILTILEAKVAADKEDILKAAFEQAGGDQLASPIRESFLVHEEGSGVWRIATVWSSREELEAYRRSVKTPAGVAMFREAGAEPTITINEVVIHTTR
jgi:hypothetical protein